MSFTFILEGLSIKTKKIYIPNNPILWQWGEKTLWHRWPVFNPELHSGFTAEIS